MDNFGDFKLERVTNEDGHRIVTERSFDVIYRAVDQDGERVGLHIAFELGSAVIIKANPLPKS